MFLCLSSRAILIEVLEAMDASTFITLQGHAKLLRCDRDTNFVRAKKKNSMMSEHSGEKVEEFTRELVCRWEFNPPHAPHFGGSGRGRLIPSDMY